MTLRRKLAIATWDAPREGNIYGKLVLDARPALEYIERRRAETGVKLTLTHIATRALSLALRDASGLNGYISRGRFLKHETVDLSVIVAINGGENLSAVKLERADEMSISEIAETLNERVNRVRVGDDESFKQNMMVAKRTPWFLLKPLLKFVGWLSTTLGWSIPAFGVRAFPFGAGILTNVGVFGVDEAYVPPTPFAGVPLYLLLGVTRDAPYVDEGEVKVRQEITLTATMDHRFVDGAQAAQLARCLREVFADPERFDERADERAEAGESSEAMTS
jgi:pyruvate dehydrogenase E2 component (dihydrolipoamide acetyltransferase)